eukprot:scaffold7831_cov108-Isochrysis_galbana.AAC.6
MGVCAAGYVRARCASRAGYASAGARLAPPRSVAWCIAPVSCIPACTIPISERGATHLGMCVEHK